MERLPLARFFSRSEVRALPMALAGRVVPPQPEASQALQVRPQAQAEEQYIPRKAPKAQTRLLAPLAWVLVLQALQQAQVEQAQI